MIERFWDIPNSDAQTEFANQNYVSEVSIDPRRFADVAEVFAAIIEGFQKDAFQITDKDKAEITKLICMCTPWFDKLNSPQQELF